MKLCITEFIVNFDKSFTTILQSLPYSNRLMHGVTHLGDPSVLISIGATIFISAIWQKKPNLVNAMVLVAVASIFNAGLKAVLHRTRPDTLYVTAMKFKSYSFPSGHAFGAMIVYGLLAYLAYLHLPSPWNWICAGLLAMIIFLVGVSRVYVGAHFPTDVLAGWLLAFILLLLIIKTTLR